MPRGIDPRRIDSLLERLNPSNRPIRSFEARADGSIAVTFGDSPEPKQSRNIGARVDPDEPVEAWDLSGKDLDGGL